MHGLGNTFVVFKGPLHLSTDEVRSYCESFGTERADGLLVVSPLSDSSVKMEYWNNDGSLSEMCGNGLRCVVRFAVENSMVEPGELLVETEVGPLQAVWDGKDPDKIEVQVGKAKLNSEKLTIMDRDFYVVDVGNPHAVTLVENLESQPVSEIGPKIEHDNHFPNRTNVEFVEVIKDDEIQLRTWERGVGETSACGTGMVAAANVCVVQNNARFPLMAKVIGGQAKLWVDAEGYTRMLGPATLV